MIQQTLPYCGCEIPHPPSQAQYGAVLDFYGECCETPYQANTMLSARDYASVVAGSFAFSAHRQFFLWQCPVAFILSDRDLRAKVRAWNISKREDHVSTSIINRNPHKLDTRKNLKILEFLASNRLKSLGRNFQYWGFCGSPACSEFAQWLIDDMRGSGSLIFG